ncbi:MAG: ribosome silencing factor [Planctomycetota bacterium]|jgi:ribosome-associated protein
MDQKEFALACAQTIDKLKASDIVILDVSEVFLLSSCFVIATARNPRHLRALTDELDRLVKKSGKKKLGVEGLDGSGWVLYDCGEIIVHLFLGEDRGLYDLEMIWGDAPEIEFTPDEKEE